MRLARQRQSPDALQHLVKFCVLGRGVADFRKCRGRTQDQPLEGGGRRPPIAQKRAQIPIPLRVLHISQIPNSPNLHLRPHDRLDPRFFRRRAKVHRPVQIQIRHRHCLRPPLRSQPYDIVRPQQRIHETEAAFHIKNG